MADSRDEFYTGYLPEAPPGIAAHVRRVILALLLVAVAVAVVLVFAQQGFSSAVYEFLVFRDFEGVIREQPYPALEVDRPGAGAARTGLKTRAMGGKPPEGDSELAEAAELQPSLEGLSSVARTFRSVRTSDADRSLFYLVAPGKLGAAAEVEGLDGRRVRLRGSLIYRDDQTMVEVEPGSVEALDGSVTVSATASPETALGSFTLKGRIVDSKCFLGIMKPGQGKPHRACATRCISGGIPPLLLVEDGEGPAAQLLLVGADGRAVNAEVLDMVDEPVEITGEVVRRDDLLVLYADPADYKRLS